MNRFTRSASRAANPADPLIPKDNIAAAQHPWVVFRDSDSQCPVTQLSRLTAGISSPHLHFCLRIAHSMSEAWLLAERDNLAECFSVSPTASHVSRRPSQCQA